MTQAEHEAIVNKILANPTDTAEVSILLSELSKDYFVVSETAEKIEKTNVELKVANEKLRSTNMQLFLERGSGPPKQTHQETSTTDESEMTFDNLFNEKGELK